MCSKDVTIIQRLLEGLTPLDERDVASMDIRWKNVKATEDHMVVKFHCFRSTRINSCSQKSKNTYFYHLDLLIHMVCKRGESFSCCLACSQDCTN